MDELWKPICNYSNYEVSNLGRIKNIKFNRILNGTINPYGYRTVRLTSDNGMFKNHLVHRLVAKHFVYNPKPEEFNIINHINERKLDNRANNLEWCTQTYNHNYGNAIKKQVIAHSDIVVAEKDDEVIIAKSGKDLKRYLNVKSAPHYAISRKYLYYGYKVRIGFTISKNKLNGNTIIKFKNNKIVDIIN